MLSDGDIFFELQQGELKLDPVDVEDIQPASVDLLLDNTFLVFDRRFRSSCWGSSTKERLWRWALRKPRPISLHAPPPMREVYVPDGQSFVIPAHGFALAKVRTRITVPNYLAVRIEGRTSLGRLAVEVHKTAAHCNPGYDGQPTMEIENGSPFPLELFPGQDYICQITIERLESPCQMPYGSQQRANPNHYQGITDVAPSLAWKGNRPRRRKHVRRFVVPTDDVPERIEVTVGGQSVSMPPPTITSKVFLRRDREESPTDVDETP